MSIHYRPDSFLYRPRVEPPGAQPLAVGPTPIGEPFLTDVFKTPRGWWNRRVARGGHAGLAVDSLHPDLGRAAAHAALHTRGRLVERLHQSHDARFSWIPLVLHSGWLEPL